MSEDLTHAQRVAQHQEKIAQIVAQQALIPPQPSEQPDTETVDINGTNVMPRCFNTYAYGEINTSSWILEEDSILFLINFPDSDTKLVCTNIDTLKDALNNENRIMYKCTSQKGLISRTKEPIFIDQNNQIYNPNTYELLIPQPPFIALSMDSMDLSKEYIPFTYGYTDTYPENGYILRSQIEEIIRRVESTEHTLLFTLEFSDTISHTVSKNNTSLGRDEPDHDSNAHCQAGTSIMIYNVNELAENVREEEGEKGKKSIIDKIIEDKIIEDKRLQSKKIENEVIRVGMQAYNNSLGDSADAKLDQAKAETELAEEAALSAKKNALMVKTIMHKKTGIYPSGEMLKKEKNLLAHKLTHIIWEVNVRDINFEEIPLTYVVVWAIVLAEQTKMWKEIADKLPENQLLQATAIADLLRERSELAASEAWNTMIELEKEVDVYHQRQLE